MKTKKRKQTKRYFPFIILASLIIFIGCSKDEEEPEPAPTSSSTTDKSYNVTVGIYILNGSTYEYQNKDLVFDTQEACQSWSRTAPADKHSSSAHDHFNAAKNTSYDPTTETITWTEYGPEIDQSSIDATCENGSNGVTKTANKTEYTADKKFFLKIKSVVEK